MRSRMGLALAAGFGSLLLLIGLLGVGALRRTAAMHQDMLAAQSAYEATDSALRDLPVSIHLMGILVRDYLLDPAPAAGPFYQEQLRKTQQSIESDLSRLRGAGEAQAGKVEQFRRETQEYVDLLKPMLGWTPAEKLTRSHAFIRDNLIRRRQSIVGLARDLQTLNALYLRNAHEARQQSQTNLSGFVTRLLFGCLALGLAVAAVATWRVTALERRSTQDRLRAEEAEREQRRLAARVVQAQEDERKRISLELHDAVGQMASAVGMELGRLETLHESAASQFHESLAEAKRMNTDVVRAIKEIAGGLRPALLDDLGLAPAIRAHAREFARRTGVAPSVRIDGDMEGVPDPQRTCIYRVVQEALNNCARHARASEVIISLQGKAAEVGVIVRDNGVGFVAAHRSGKGLGLMGIQERARDLGGQSTVTSSPGRGTMVEVRLPLHAQGAA